jgi:hypothetical protein
MIKYGQISRNLLNLPVLFLDAFAPTLAVFFLNITFIQKHFALFIIFILPVDLFITSLLVLYGSTCFAIVFHERTPFSLLGMYASNTQQHEGVKDRQLDAKQIALDILIWERTAQRRFSVFVCFLLRGSDELDWLIDDPWSRRRLTKISVRLVFFVLLIFWCNFSLDY